MNHTMIKITNSDYNGPKSNDTYELTTINDMPVFVSAEWRDASNGSKSIADWVYETTKPVAPICYFKALSQIQLCTLFIFGIIGMRLCLRILKGNQSYCFCSKCCYTNRTFYSNYSSPWIPATWQNYGDFAYDYKTISQRTR